MGVAPLRTVVRDRECGRNSGTVRGSSHAAQSMRSRNGWEDRNGGNNHSARISFPGKSGRTGWGKLLSPALPARLHRAEPARQPSGGHTCAEETGCNDRRELLSK